MAPLTTDPLGLGAAAHELEADVHSIRAELLYLAPDPDLEVLLVGVDRHSVCSRSVDRDDAVARDDSRAVLGSQLLQVRKREVRGLRPVGGPKDRAEHFESFPRYR